MSPWPGPTPPGRFACERCGVELWNECVPIGRGYFLCVGCAGCDRCGAAPVPTFRTGPRERACSGCLTPDEQADVGQAGTSPEIR